MQATTARSLNTNAVHNVNRQYEVLKGTKRENRIMTIRSGLFLSASLIILALTCTYYITLQSGITNSVKHISSLKSTLNEIRLDNDENYSRITSNVNLDEIRRIAIQELGMQYADEGQIISFNSEGSDYVRQLGSLPE